MIDLVGVDMLFPNSLQRFVLRLLGGIQPSRFLFQRDVPGMIEPGRQREAYLATICIHNRSVA